MPVIADGAEFGPFGEVALYSSSQQPHNVVLFVSGDGGWNQGVVEMAQALSGLDALVVGIDITRYLRRLEAGGGCLYPAADFEALSHFIQKRHGFSHYRPPILVGYSSGATLVYAIVAQAPVNTFAGALSLGFCPDLPLTRPLCRGSGLEARPLSSGKGYLLGPSDHLETPWIAFQGSDDQVCDPEITDDFVRKTRGAEVIPLPKVGHGFSVQRNWMPEFKEAFARLTAGRAHDSAPGAGSLADLPLVEVPADDSLSPVMAVMVSGDGGWASLDKEVAGELAARGVAVVGLNALQYFWTPKTPDMAAHDLARILHYYLARWHKDEIVLVGYSLGADVLPFMASRLPQDLRARIALIALLGPGHAADFEIHVSDWLGGGPTTTAQPVLPEVQKLKDLKLLCTYGSDETDTLCRETAAGFAKTVEMPGGHHFGGRYREIGDAILDALDQGS